MIVCILNFNVQMKGKGETYVNEQMEEQKQWNYSYSACNNDRCSFNIGWSQYKYANWRKWNFNAGSKG